MNSKSEPNVPRDGDAIIEPGQATVDDWFGQDLERDAEDAERALELAGADETGAEEIFEDIRRPHKSDQYDVPADERPV
jgi:hypothetical protein